MRIVSIETSGQRGSIAILSGEKDTPRLVEQTILASDERTAKSLAPALRSLLDGAGWQPGSIQLVAAVVGPGSFTGLRIGVTTAKVLAYAVGADVVGVNTLRVLARQAPDSPSPLWTIMDAQRGELFAAKFAATESGELLMVRETSIMAQAAWLGELHPSDRVTGPALRRILPRLPAGITVVPEERWQPTAVAAGIAAWRAHRGGQRDDIWKLVPHYYRASAAEEKANRPKPTTSN